MMPEMEYIPLDSLNLTDDEIREASAIFNKTFSFYGGYAQLSANAKD
jgi:hypothetical protein